MKIALFTENYYKGGLDTFIINLVNNWPIKTDEFILICNKNHPGLNKIKLHSTSITIVEYSSYISDILNKESNILFNIIFKFIYRLFEYPIILPWYLISLTYKFKYCNCDKMMVINGGYPASLLCRASSIAWYLSGKQSRAIFNFHNLVYSSKFPFSFFDNYMDKLIIKCSHSFITVSDACRRTLYNRPAFINYTKSFYIHNGINHNFNNKIEQFQIPTKPYCLMLATYEPRKGHEYLLKAFKLVLKSFPDVELKIFGYGKQIEKDKIIDLISSLKLEDRVNLYEFVDNSQHLISNSKILLIPSQAFESFGLTAIEAMSFGIPIVSTDVGGLPEVISNSGAGLICSKNSHVEFANAIVLILSSPKLEKSFSEQGLITFHNNFTAKKMSIQYAKHFKSI